MQCQNIKLFLKVSTLLPFVQRGCRSLHTSVVVAQVQKVPLSKLRKKTGFSFIKCKEALTKFDNDIKQAEDWLREQAQKEGWTKASKLQGRPMSQGLVAITHKPGMAAIVEVNCETDFVARNPKFQDFVKTVCSTALAQGEAGQGNKILWKRSTMDALPVGEQTLSDVAALQIGSLGENMVAQRGAYMRATQGHQVGAYIHAAGGPVAGSSVSCIMGKYGALVSFSQSEPSLQETNVKLEDIGRMLAQHIVGMNPKSIGDMEQFENKTESKQEAGETGSEAQETDGEDDKQEAQSDDDEDRMIFQDFLVESGRKVGDFLLEHNVTVQDYVRFECGEEIDEDDL